MATITPGAYTYTEWAMRNDPSGRLAALVDLTSKTTPFIKDALCVECQSGNAYEFTQVVALPTSTRRGYNQGVPSTPGVTAKLTTTCSEYADWSKLDCSLADLGGNPQARRAQEAALHMQGQGQKVETDMFYSNKSTDPTAFTGLSNIYNTVSLATSPIAQNVIDCGGTGSTNTSMWLITWGERQIHTIGPNGMPVGMTTKDMGMGWALDANSNEYPIYRDWIQWNVGLAIEDWRYGVRACNIDVSLLGGGSAANLINILLRMTHRPPTTPYGVGPNPVTSADMDSRVQTLSSSMRSAIYVNRDLATYLDIQALNKTNVLLQMQQWGGEAVTTFRGIPIRVADQLLSTESRVV